ncbi:hypothetical protein [Nocardia sp. NPDC051570]|uniref:hypothetical protein n=1 Tax=Nocardia sp. NPDC051570 TaxID=3364324 RepID=UPI003795FEEE
MAHNTTATTRLFDTLGILARDPRIRIYFTRPQSSPFDTDTREFLATHGATEIEWQDAVALDFDMTISASYGGELHRLQAPLIVIPHGMGYNKYQNKEQRTKNKEQRTKNKEQSVFGLSPDWLLHDGKVVPSVIVLSHTEQRERLRRSCPQAVSRTLIAGDICYDRLRASRPFRPSYRRAYGLRTAQRLIVISTTWGPDSILGTISDLPRKLAAELPVDEYRIALALHPNIRSFHSRWQVSEYLSDSARAGVEVLDDVQDWRTAVVAADLIVGDHGSIPFYGAALGIPLLLATAPVQSVAPDSPSAQLLGTAPRLDIDADIRQQIERTISEHRPDHYTDIARLTTSAPDEGAALLRTVMYRTLNLPEPAEAVDITVLPLPAQTLDGPDSHLVRVRLGADRSADITRFPAERLHASLDNGPETHLSVGMREPLRHWLDRADVVIGTSGPDTDQWISDTLSRLPGCALAAAPTPSGDWLLGDRATVLRLTARMPAPRLFASLAYRLLCEHSGLVELVGEWTIRCGADMFTVTAAPADHSIPAPRP